MSFLRFSQADISLGDYEGQVLDAVDELLAILTPRPRVLSLYVNCVDDFLGTDEESLTAALLARHPDVRFTFSHINPIAADVAASSAASGIQARLYSLLEAPRAHDAGVTLTGSFVPAGRGELAEALRALGFGPVRELPACRTFDDYLDLARSGLVLSLSFLGDAPARLMEERFGIPWHAWHSTYDLREIDRHYAELQARSGGDRRGEDPERVASAVPALRNARARAEAAVARARAVVGDLPVFVDSAASLMPFSLACALLGYGFAVRGVFGLHLKGCDDAAQAQLAAEHPEVAIITHQSHEAIQGFGFPRECLAIGQDAAFLVQANHAVDLYHDEGFFGYDGVARLMDAMAAAVESGTHVAREGGEA